MFKNKTVALVVLAVLTVLFLAAALVIDAGAALIGESQEGCLYISEVAWAGTDASPSDEWYEIGNACGFPFSTETFYLETTNEDLEVSQAALPVVDIPANGLCLFERTDDNAVASQTACGINGSSGTGESLTGIFTNSGVVSFGLFSETVTETYHEMTLDGDWAAGTSSPRASMQWVGGVWYTSNQGTETDANGTTILGTPGLPNELPTDSPNTCGAFPDDIEFDLDIVVLEDFSQQAQITVQADLWGVGDGGSLIQTAGEFQFSWIQGAWVPTVFEYGEDTSNDCIDALELVKDATENILQGDPSNTGNTLPPYWMTYSSFLNGVLQFQKSGLFSTYIPAVQN